MKLQAQYNRIAILSTFFILLIAAAGYYLLVSYVLRDQLDKDLKIEEEEIYDHVQKSGNLPPATVYKDQRIAFQPATAPVTRRFTSLEIDNGDGNGKEPGRQLIFPVVIGSQYYTATVTKSAEATENLVLIILFATLLLIVLLTAILFFTNRFLLKKLWQPFRHTLSSIKEFDLSAPAELNMPPTHIREFSELNDSIRLMSKKVMRDYQSLKDFTDHASHEMQTPLAVINSKLDVLIQEPDLSEKTMGQLEGIYRAVEKLSRLCQSLLLLARIENNQYAFTQSIAIDELVKEKMDEMQEWIAATGLHTESRLAPLQVSMNKELADILLGNLLGNAIRHTAPGGQILVQTTGQKLFIYNSGKHLLDHYKVFTRFYKSELSGGSGLGLAIVKQVCDQYRFALNYQFSNDLHCFSIDFSRY